MSYEFQETLEVFIPDFESKLSSFGESAEFGENHGLIVEIAAIHEGVTSNFNYYSAQELERSLASWTTPYPKPIIMNHDPHSEPIGRIIGAKMDKEDDGTPYVRLQAAILDPEAIKKVSDGRYLTGSIGGKSNEAVCSVCDTDWAQAREGQRSLPCRHQRGKVYNGKVATLVRRGVENKEYSFVNMPADGVSGIRDKNASTESDEAWVRSARFFVLDMQEQHIIEYTESEDRDVLEGMRKKDSLPLYMSLKGAILSAIAINEEEIEDENGVNTHKDNTNEFDSSNSKEKVMADTVTQETEDDILAVVEGLQKEAPAQEEAEVTEPQEEETAPAEDKASEEEGAVEDTGNEESEGKAGERSAQGQEKSQNKDVDPETSENAPKSRESEEEAPEAEKAEEETATEEPAEDKSEESDDKHSDTELDTAEATEDKTVVEPHEEDELKVRLAELTEENARLKKALHRTLAEKVVDTKIVAGLVEEETRAEAIDEHAQRTAASLADSLRDLAGIKPAVKSSKTSADAVNKLKVNEESEVVDADEENVTTTDTEESDEGDTPELRLENLLVGALTGKVKL